MMIAKIIDDNDEEIDEIELNEKEFKTGNIGFHGFGKIYIGDKKYQVNFILVEIGSKDDRE